MKLAALALALVLSASARAQPPTSDELRSIVRKALTGLTREDEVRGDYLFTARSERKELDSAGKVVSQESHKWERIEIDGFPFGRTLERNGKPLTADERKAEDVAMQRKLAELKSPVEAAGLGGASSAKSAKRPRQDEWYLELPNALDYQLAGEEAVNGRPALHLAARPKPGYQARNLRARVFEKMKASIWIDKASSELVKADAEMFDTVSVGFGVLGKVEKGTRFRIQRQLLDDGVWLIDSQSVHFSARILLFKTVRNESSTEWSDFRRRINLPSGAAKK